MIAEFTATFRFLAATPAVGHKRVDLVESRDVLFWPLRDYLILYMPGTSPLQIILVVHGSRDVPAILGQRRDI